MQAALNAAWLAKLLEAQRSLVKQILNLTLTLSLSLTLILTSTLAQSLPPTL